MLKSMLQQLDSNQAAKENAVQDQNDKLSEKDRIIQSNKAEIERLEKRTKMYEHKVQNKTEIHGLKVCFLSLPKENGFSFLD